jgi:type III secretion protein V
MLTECVRIDLGRQIASTVCDEKNHVNAIVVDPRAETMIRQSVQQTPSGSFAGLTPEQSQRILNQLAELLHKHAAATTLLLPVVLTSMDVRRYLKKLIERSHPDVRVLSYQELAVGVSINAVGRLEG